MIMIIMIDTIDNNRSYFFVFKYSLLLLLTFNQVLNLTFHIHNSFHLSLVVLLHLLILYTLCLFHLFELFV